MIEQNKKIRISFFLPSLEGGGTERNVVNLLRNFNKNDYDLFLVLGEKKGVFLKEISQDIPIIDFNANNSLIVFLKLIKYFKKEKPDFFVSAFPHFNIISILARNFSKAKTKIIITEHTPPSFFPDAVKSIFRKLIACIFLPFLRKIIYPKADRIVCVSQGVAEEFSNINGAKEKVRVIYNPVAEERIHQLSQEPVKHPWFQNANIPLIISVNRLIKIKDFPTLLSAFVLVLKEQSARLVVLGEGEERQKLEKLSEKLGISENVAFLGFQENPYKFMKRSSVFVLSSKFEGFCNALIETMTCGTPVVSTNCVSGPGEIIENGKSGILVPVSNPQALAEAILKVLNNPSLAHKFSDEGKKRAEYFSVEKSVKEYEKLILELLTT